MFYSHLRNRVNKTCLRNRDQGTFAKLCVISSFFFLQNTEELSRATGLFTPLRAGSIHHRFLFVTDELHGLSKYELFFFVRCKRLFEQFLFYDMFVSIANVLIQ